MKKSKVRVRFAPSPTGMMHLGNVRTALMNYLFAKQKDGTFILRIEDTDPERNFDPEAKHIIDDLTWMGLLFDEGPYFQSQRMNTYQEHLEILIKNKQVYRCFCSTETLEKKRSRQIALKVPPRYDRTCLKLSDQEIQEKLDSNTPFIWRTKLDPNESVTIEDIAHKTITFELKHFSDFPVTRQNGTFTFMFANFVDDMTMHISHVVRGEDHLSNTAGQAALYKALGAPMPIFWHMPILCNKEGKKLSKRDFGFSLQDLRKGGYLPEAICNYLAVIGSSFQNETMSLAQLAETINFEHSQAKGQIKYDVEQLQSLNHKWINVYDPETLTTICLNYLKDKFPTTENIDHSKLTQLIQTIKTDLITVADVQQTLEFYFITPINTKETIAQIASLNKIKTIVANNLNLIDNADQFITKLKLDAKKEQINLKEMFSFIRLCLMGKTKGPGIHELLDMLGSSEAKKRIEQTLKL